MTKMCNKIKGFADKFLLILCSETICKSGSLQFSKHKYFQFGRSMVEMLGVLAIIAILSIGAIGGYTKAMGKYKTNKLIEQVSMLITNIRTIFTMQQTYVGLNNQFALDLDLVPQDMLGKNYRDPTTKEYISDVILNNFGGRVYISAVSVYGADASYTDNGAFYVTFYGLPRDACIALAAADWGAVSGSGLMGMHVFGEAEYSDDGDEVVADINRQMTTGSAAEGNYVGVPNGLVVKIPLTVQQARHACKCLQISNCAFSLKYF